MKLWGVNRSGKHVPPYAVVSLLTDLDGTNGLRIRQDGGAEVDIFQCRDFDEHLQNPALLAIVGPQGIRNGGTGEISQSWPALVKVEDADSSYGGLQRGGYVPGWRVGVKSGSWAVSANSAGAFGYVGPAVTSSGKDVTAVGSSVDVSLGLISALVPRVSPGCTFTETLAALVVPNGTFVSPLSGGVSNGSADPVTSMVVNANGMWFFRFSGAFVFHFHGAFSLGGEYSNTVELVPQVARRLPGETQANPASAVSLPFRAYAEVPASFQDVYNDAGDYSEEDVSMIAHLSLSGVFMAQAGDGFRIRVDCTGNTNIRSGPGITFHRVGPYYVSDDYLLRTSTP